MLVGHAIEVFGGGRVLVDRLAFGLGHPAQDCGFCTLNAIVGEDLLNDRITLYLEFQQIVFKAKLADVGEHTFACLIVFAHQAGNHGRNLLLCSLF